MRRSRPKIYDTIRQVWLRSETFQESMFHAFIAGKTWNAFVRDAIIAYNEKCSNEPETPETIEREKEFPKFWNQNVKKQIKPKKGK